MSDQISPLSSSSQDEVSLIDIWLTMVKHQKIFWWLSALTIFCGFLFSVLRPTLYTVSSMIKIGSLIQDGVYSHIENPATVKAKLEQALGPSILAEIKPNQSQIEFSFSVPKNSNLVFIQSQVRNEDVSAAISLQNELIARLVKDHDQILNVHRLKIEAQSVNAVEQLRLLNDERLQLPAKTALQAEIQNAKSELNRLTDPVILAQKKKDMDIQHEIEKQKLDSLKGEEIKLGQISATVEVAKNLLVRQIAELKNQIEQSAELSGTIAKTDSGNPQTLMLLLITNNELGQNRNRLAALEERLLVTLENDKLELQNAMENNRRMQSHQANIITRMEYIVKVDEIENRLKKAGQVIEVAKAEARLSELEALHEQKLADIQLEISGYQAKFKDMVSTQAITPPLRSQTPTSLSMTGTMMISALLGVCLGIVGIFSQAFIENARTARTSGA